MKALSAAVLATALGISRQGVWKRAQAEDWPYVTGTRGARLYLLEGLPAAVRERAVAHVLDQTAPLVASQSGPAPAAQVPACLTAPLRDWQAEVRDARLGVLEAVRGLADSINVGIIRAEAAFAEMAAAGTLAPRLAELAAVANARKGEQRAVSAVTLRLWRTTLDRLGPDALAPKPSRLPDNAPPAWLGPFLKLYRRPGKPTMAECYDVATTQGLRLPSISAVERTIKRLGAVQVSKGRMGPRALRNLQAYVKRTFKELLPGDVYTADGHRQDMKVLHPDHGQPFRPEAVAVLDIASRRCVGWSSWEHESAGLVADALRHSVETAGIPAIFYADNGCGFKNEMLGREGDGLLLRMGVRIEHSVPYNSQARGVIEQFQKTWIRSARMLPGYCGWDMDDEAEKKIHTLAVAHIKERGTSPLYPTWDQYLAWMDEQVRAYNARPHRGLPRIQDPQTGKLRHQTPDERWAELARDPLCELFHPSADEAAELFRPHLVRTCRRCLVTLFNREYYAPELEAMHGQEVQVAYDLHDFSKVWVRNLDGQLLAIAKQDGHAAAYFPQSTIEAAREGRRKAQLKRAQAKVVELQGYVLGGTELPRTPSLAHDQGVQGGLSPLEAASIAPAPAGNPKRERFLKAQALEARRTGGEALSPHEAKWLDHYVTTPEYLSQARLYEEFGDVALG